MRSSGDLRSDQHALDDVDGSTTLVVLVVVVVVVVEVVETAASDDDVTSVDKVTVVGSMAELTTLDVTTETAEDVVLMVEWSACCVVNVVESVDGVADVEDVDSAEIRMLVVSAHVVVVMLLMVVFEVSALSSGRRCPLIAVALVALEFAWRALNRRIFRFRKTGRRRAKCRCCVLRTNENGL